MKSVCCIVFLLISFVTLSFADVSFDRFKDPRYPGKCTITENLILSNGQIGKYPTVDCGRIICGGDGFAEIHTCETVRVKGCKQGDFIDKSLPFPDCCKRKMICRN